MLMYNLKLDQDNLNDHGMLFLLIVPCEQKCSSYQKPAHHKLDNFASNQKFLITISFSPSFVSHENFEAIILARHGMGRKKSFEEQNQSMK